MSATCDSSTLLTTFDGLNTNNMPVKMCQIPQLGSRSQEFENGITEFLG